MGFGVGVWGLGFGVWGLGFGVWGLGFGVWGLGFRLWGFCLVGSGRRVWGVGGSRRKRILVAFLGSLPPKKLVALVGFPVLPQALESRNKSMRENHLT